MRHFIPRFLQAFVVFLILGTSLFAQTADLSVTKTDNPDPVAAGSFLDYVLTVTNNGPDTAVNVVLNDVLPAGTTFFSFNHNAGPAGTCTQPPGAFNCTYPSLTSGQFSQYTLTVNVTPGTTGTLSNTATVTTTTTDPNATNNSETETTTVLSDADLSVTKTDSPDPVAAGSNLSYVLTVTNNGPATAQNIEVNDVLPAGTTFVNSNHNAGPAPTCTQPPGAFNCTFPSLTSGQVWQLTITVNVTPGTTGTLSNTATVTTTTTDPNATNNSDTETTTVLSDADLSVTKTDSPDPVAAGSNLDYVVTVTNNGPATAQNIVLNDVLPAGTTFVNSNHNAGPAGTCTQPPPGGTGAFNCTYPSLTSGQFSQYTLTVNVNPAISGTLTNTASVTTTTTDPTPANNSDTETTTVPLASADLSVTKTDSPDPVTEGQNITYTITVANAGPDTAPNVELLDFVPPGTTFVSFTTIGGWTTTFIGGLNRATNPSLTVAAGPQTFTFVVNVNVGATSPITNTATVSSGIADPNSANNGATATTTVSPAGADLSVTKTDSPDPVTAGQNITYTITVNNAGPNPASAVSLSDTIPTGTTFVSFTAPAGWATTTPPVGGTGTVTATNPNVAVATPDVFTLIVNVNPATAGTVTNTASVTSSTADPNAANNTATATTTANAPVVNADMAITKVAGAGPFVAGGNVNFTITVTNNGPAAATNVSVLDTLPAGSTFVSAIPSQGSCTGTGPVTCALGGLAASGSATIALVVQSSATPGTLTNTATVSATQTDPNATNNTASANATTTGPPAGNIPTLSVWMLLVLALTLGGLGLVLLRGR